MINGTLVQRSEVVLRLEVHVLKTLYYSTHFISHLNVPNKFISCISELIIHEWENKSYPGKPVPSGHETCVIIIQRKLLIL